MTNYFARLARTTGLNFGAAAEPRAALEHETKPGRTSLAEPPHVEELRFVEAETRAPAPFEPPQHDDHAQEMNAPARASTREEGHASVRASPPAEPGVFADERPSPAERAAASRSPTFFEESRVELVQREEAHAARLPVARERTSTPDEAPPAHDATSLSQTRSGQESSQPARLLETTADEPAREDAGPVGLEALEVSEVVRLPDVPAPQAEPPINHAAQAEARRAYLREVVQWITGPADSASEVDSSSAVEAESFASAESKASRPSAVVLQRERAEASRELEVQDFSLSIGSISIVVEDAPKPATAAAHRTEPGEQRPGPAPIETSRLRRHYIRGL